MYDEHGEPSETLIEQWNSHNDHAEDGDVDETQVKPTQDECDECAWMDQVDLWRDQISEPPVLTGVDEIVYADEAEYGRNR